MAQVMPADPTLDEIRAHLGPMIANHAAFDGWTDEAVERAANDADIDSGAAKLAFPKGATDMIDAWFAHIDAEMEASFTAEELDAMPIHKRIRAAILKRLDIARPHKEALRRAIAVLAMAQKCPACR